MSACQDTVDTMAVFEPMENKGNEWYPRRFLNESGTTVENGRLVFEVPSQLDPISFYDSSIGFSMQITKKTDGTALAAGVMEVVSVVNQPGLSMIRHIDVYANGRICSSNQFHQYSA